MNNLQDLKLRDITVLNSVSLMTTPSSSGSGSGASGNGSGSGSGSSLDLDPIIGGLIGIVGFHMDQVTVLVTVHIALRGNVEWLNLLSHLLSGLLGVLGRL